MSCRDERLLAGRIHGLTVRVTSSLSTRENTSLVVQVSITVKIANAKWGSAMDQLILVGPML